MIRSFYLSTCNCLSMFISEIPSVICSDVMQPKNNCLSFFVFLVLGGNACQLLPDCALAFYQTSVSISPGPPGLFVCFFVCLLVLLFVCLLGCIFVFMLLLFSLFLCSLACLLVCLFVCFFVYFCLIRNMDLCNAPPGVCVRLQALYYKLDINCKRSKHLFSRQTMIGSTTDL